MSIAPNDANIVYSPFNWGVTSGVSKTINAGAYFRALITGSATAITLLFDVSDDLTPLPEISYRLDDGPWTVETLAASIDMVIPDSNAWDVHMLTVVVKSMTETEHRWEPQDTDVSFSGIATSPDSCTTEPVQKRGLVGLFYGDSITEGTRTLGDSETNDTDRNSSLQGWAYQVADNLGAEVGIVGFGGSGLTVTGSGGVPVLAASYDLLWGGGPSRTFSAPVPDFIVLNEGTNDSGTSSGTFQADYTSILNDLLAVTPETTVILAMRPFKGTHASDVSAACAACNAPSRVFYVDTTGWLNSADSSDGAHPYGYTNTAKLSPLVVTAIRSAFAARGPMFIGLGGREVQSLSPYRG